MDEQNKTKKAGIVTKKIMTFAVLVFLATGLSGCAAAWFAGGAATGAAVQHHADKH